PSRRKARASGSEIDGSSSASNTLVMHSMLRRTFAITLPRRSEIAVTIWSSRHSWWRISRRYFPARPKSSKTIRILNKTRVLIRFYPSCPWVDSAGLPLSVRGLVDRTTVIGIGYPRPALGNPLVPDASDRGYAMAAARERPIFAARGREPSNEIG